MPRDSLSNALRQLRLLPVDPDYTYHGTTIRKGKDTAVLSEESMGSTRDGTPFQRRFHAILTPINAIFTPFARQSMQIDAD